VVEAIRISAGALGNTAAVARRSYVHPAIPQAYVDGLIEPPRRRAAVGPAAVTPADADASAELAVIELLQGPLDRDAARVTAIATRGVQAREPPG
jgi:DNA topoisomerase-1